MSRKDGTRPYDMQQYYVTLSDGDVSNQAEVAGERVLEHDCVLALHYEAGYVKGPEVDPGIHVWCIVAAAREMVQPCRNINNQVTIYQDLELSHTVVKVVQVKPSESQENRLASRRRDSDSV